MQNLKKMIKMNFTDRKQTYGYQRGKVGGWINWEIRIDIYTQLYVK